MQVVKKAARYDHKSVQLSIFLFFVKLENVHSEKGLSSKMLQSKICLAYIFCNWDELLHCCEASWEQPHHEILMSGEVLILSGEKDP